MVLKLRSKKRRDNRKIMKHNNYNELENTFELIRKEAYKKHPTPKKRRTPVISIGKGTCGLASGAQDTQEAFERSLEEYSIEAVVRSTGCLGHCYAEPVVVIDNPESGFPPILYPNVTPGKAKMLVKSYLIDLDPLFEHMLGATEENDLIPRVMDFPRFNQEKRIVTENCGIIDPEDIYEYISADGYSALYGALQLNGNEIINQVRDSGIRGRGGAGFPTGDILP